MAKKKSGKGKSSRGSAPLANTEAQNAAKTLFSNIRFMSVDDPIRSIAITSSVPNEGKSTVSLLLTQAIATAGHRVLVVECDMRRRSIAAAIGVQSRAGLYAVLTGAAKLQQSVARIPVGSFSSMDFLDVEPGIPNPPDILASKRFRDFVREAQSIYDYVIFDTPPVCAFVDGAVMSSVVDATILVVNTGEVKRENLINAYEQLRKAGGNIIGTVANFVEEDKSEYYYSYYYEDGTRSSKSRSEGFQPPAPTAPVSYVQQPAGAAKPAAKTTVAASFPTATSSKGTGSAYAAAASKPAASGSAAQASGHSAPSAKTQTKYAADVRAAPRHTAGRPIPVPMESETPDNRPTTAHHPAPSRAGSRANNAAKASGERV